MSAIIIPANEPWVRRGIDSVDAELMLLGAIIYKAEALELSGVTVSGEQYADPLFGWLFDRAVEIIKRGDHADPVALHNVAQGYGAAYEDLGGIDFLSDLAAKAPEPEQASIYARVIYDAHARRSMVRVCQEAAQTGLRDRERPAFELIAETRKTLELIETEAAPEDATMISAPDAAARAIATMRELSEQGRGRGAMTGLRCIDRRLNGLQPGAVVVIGGRPGMCKTGLARAAAHGAAVRNPNKLFLFLGIEMGPEEMMNRELSALTHELGEGIEYRAMASGALTPMDFMNISEAHKRVPHNLILDDCASLSIEDVRRKVWALRRRGTVAAVFIDYLQIMRRPPAHGRNDATVLAEMTSTLKQIARQAGITVVLLSQLSRAVEQRDDKKPQLSDLRDSGSIEQDADAVLFPFREFYYLQKAEPKAGGEAHLSWEIQLEDVRRRLDVICAKQRGGPEGLDRQRYFAEFDFIEDAHE